MPATVPATRVPARLSHRMSLNIVGGVNSAAPPRVCSSELFCPVETPAGAGCPLLVTAVAVVMFLTMVSLTIRTSDVSSIAIPPPSWVEMLLAMMLFTTFIGAVPAIRNRIPPPSSLARLAWMTLLVISTAPEPGERIEGSVGS